MSQKNSLPLQTFSVFVTIVLMTGIIFFFLFYWAESERYRRMLPELNTLMAESGLIYKAGPLRPADQKKRLRFRCPRSFYCYTRTDAEGYIWIFPIYDGGALNICLSIEGEGGQLSDPVLLGKNLSFHSTMPGLVELYFASLKNTLEQQYGR